MSLHVHTSIDVWPLITPFKITGYTFTEIEVLTVKVSDGKYTGHGEAFGVYYNQETASSMQVQIESIKDKLSKDISNEQLLTLLPPGGARNALDCALWELKSKQHDIAPWHLSERLNVQPILTTRTIFADSPEEMANAASTTYANVSRLKLKLLGDGKDEERLNLIRKACPQSMIIIDANQGFTPESFAQLLPNLVKNDIALIEQPFPRNCDHYLDDLACPIPLAADESVLCLADLQTLHDNYGVVNIKLDKCGGLTEALLMVKEIQRRGKKVMVGCMTSTSLSMAPAFIVAQFAEYVDLDGPLYLAKDYNPSVKYENNYLSVPEQVWGRQSRNEL